jgi:hypothetical protein
MRDFQFVVRDDRYSVATQLRVATEDEASARDLAEAALERSSHLMVEVWEHDRRLFSIGARTTHLDPHP